MCCCCGESGGHRRPEYERNLAGDFFHRFRTDYPLCAASLLFFGTLAAGLVTELPAPVRIGGYLTAWLLVIVKLFPELREQLRRKQFFNEFTLMIAATAGAFWLGEYAEGAAVILFYSVGEMFQELAVDHARNSVLSMLDFSGDRIRVHRDGGTVAVTVREAAAGDVVTLAPGEKVPLDGELLSASAVMNTSAVTGEPVPAEMECGARLYAGMINGGRACEMRVTACWEEGSTAKILHNIEEAAERKSRVQRFITRVAAVYTPYVFGLAVLITILPALFAREYEFSVWFGRALIFLVISCPCALVVSIPLGYFGGIGLASKNGLFFKGANYLDVVTRLTCIAFDKTGTLTKGILSVKRTVTLPGAPEWLPFVIALESGSNHPAAQAVARLGEGMRGLPEIVEAEELPGMGLRGISGDTEILAGNRRLFESRRIALPEVESDLNCVFVALNGTPVGYFLLDDVVKEETAEALERLRGEGIRTVLLSGDREATARRVAESLGIEEVHAELLPDDKRTVLRELKKESATVAFVGDGINDAAVLAESDLGIAIGKNGSDLAIDAADLVIRDGDLRRIDLAIRIGRRTRAVVWQNIVFAFTVKAAVLILGAFGAATMWEAVFADVGVALLAILNAVRIQRSELEL